MYLTAVDIFAEAQRKNQQEDAYIERAHTKLQ